MNRQEDTTEVIVTSNGMRFRYPLGHEFVAPPTWTFDSQAYGYPPDEGCAFIVLGNGWTMSDPIRCRRSKSEHGPFPLTKYDDMFYWIRRAIYPTWWERLVDWWRGAYD